MKKIILVRGASLNPLLLMVTVFFIFSFSLVFGRGSKEKEFDPKKINIDEIRSDQQFAETIPEYRLRFTGIVEKDREITFREIVTAYSDYVQTFRAKGTRTDEKIIEFEYTGINTSELIKDLGIGISGKNVVIYGNDKYAASIPLSDFLEGRVWLVWKREGQYLVPGEDGVLKIVQDGGLTKNWIKNPVLFEFTAGFFDKVPQADRLNPNEINFVDQQRMFTLSIGVSPKIEEKSWRLKVGGLVENRKVYTYEDILEMPQITVYATLETISNPPGGRLIGNALWTGVPMSYIFEQVKPKKEAIEVVFRCEDGYSTSITLQEALKEGVMLAYRMNGAPLQPEHGYPLRAVVPEKYGMKWPKWITEVEFVDYDYKGYWEKRGWSDYAGRGRPDQRYD